jgi:hypothetical protein
VEVLITHHLRTEKSVNNKNVCHGVTAPTDSNANRSISMTIYQPYTYLIGWTKLDLWYYGVRFAKDCYPGDLWVTYFTSSKYVQEVRELHGEPDVLEIRKTFDTKEKAILWEHKVLKRIGVVGSDRWLNKSTAMGFDTSELWKDNEYREKVCLGVSKAAIERWKDNEFREKSSVNMKKASIERVKNKTHQFTDGAWQTEQLLKRVANGTHPFLGGDLQRKRIENGTHNLKGGVTCRDKTGNVVQVPLDIYNKQKEVTPDRSQWEFVNAGSFEGKKRKAINTIKT